MSEYALVSFDSPASFRARISEKTEEKSEKYRERLRGESKISLRKNKKKKREREGY